MNRFLRYTLAGCFLAAAAVSLAAALGSSAAKHKQLVCSRLDVTISDSLENTFVSKSDIKAYLDKEAGGYIGKPAAELDLVKIEKIVDGRSAVLKSEAYITKDGTLNISVTQRKPVIRFQKEGGGFYADRDGYLFPLQQSYTAYVPIVDGSLPLKADSGYKGEAGSPQEKAWISRMISLVEYMEESRVWAENIVQINVRPDGDLVLVPREGKEKFIFGGPGNIRDKFQRMEKYYECIVPAKGKGYYSTVNVKFDGQIICRK